jgi:DNA-binding PadR family transcriptional regulator
VLNKFEKSDMIESKWGENEDISRTGARRRYYRRKANGKRYQNIPKVKFFNKLISAIPSPA